MVAVMFSLLLSSLALLPFSLAHYRIDYPYWRGDSYSTQWERPCGGVNQSMSDGNRTEWPVDGGSLVFQPSHPWAYTFVNLALGGDNTTNFNISLVEGFNQTGNGTFCFPKLVLPADLTVADGMNASLQVVQVNAHGSALYNCADITFATDAETLGSDACANSTGVGGSQLIAESATSSDNDDSSTSSASSTNASDDGARSEVLTGLFMLAVPGAIGYQLL